MKTSRRFGSLLLLGLLVGCGAASPEPEVPIVPPPVSQPKVAKTPPPVVLTTPDAPFRQKAPAADGSVTFVPPKIETLKLKNGLRVLFVERRDLPIVSVRVVIKGGAGDYDFKPGVASFMGSMLEQGAGKRSALEISDEYEAIGAQHGAGVDWDSAYVAVKVMSEHLERALDLLADVTLRPTFPEAEIERQKERRLGNLVQERRSAGAMAGNAVSATVFGRKHPYGHALVGREEDVKAVKKGALEGAYRTLFNAKHATLVVAGDVAKDDVIAKLEKAFGGWKPTAGAAPKAPATPKLSEKESRLVFVDLPKATQTQVLLAQPGAPFGSPDREVISVLNAILGGTFGSRINLNLREDKGITYGARSRFGLYRGAGSFTAGGAMAAKDGGGLAAATTVAIRELFAEVQKMRDVEVSDDELKNAKEQMKLAMPGRFETVSEVTSALEDLAVYDLPADDFGKRVARIEAVTAKDIKRVATDLLRPKAMKVVVVGDKAKLEADLDKLHLGPMDVRDATGEPVKADAPKKEEPSAAPSKTDTKPSAPKAGAPKKEPALKK